jgi:flagellar assembly protein FliH
MVKGETAMTIKAAQGKEKFFFNVNIFDERPEPEEPPPPMFSEAELEAAQKKSFAEGKQEGLAESAASRDQQVAKMIDKIAQDMAILFTAEQKREKTYEIEVVNLCLAVFQKALPMYQEKFGAEELKRTLEAILKRQEGQKHILVHVTPDMVDGITAHLQKLKATGFEPNVTVQADEALPAGGSRLSWADGGAVRNPAAMAADMESALKDLLAGAATKVHDG